MKSKKTLMLLSLLIMLGLVSCAEHDNPVADDGTSTQVDPGSAEFKPEVLVHFAPLYVAPGVDADLTQAFTWATAVQAGSPEEANILVLNKLTDVSEAVLEKALSGENANSFLICLVNPVKAEIDAYAESHDWFDIDTYSVDDELFIFGFNANNQRYRIYEPTAEEDGDPIAANINRAQNNYVQISAMLTDFEERSSASAQDSGNDKDKPSMEDFANALHESVTFSSDANWTFRKIALSEPDVFTGFRSATAQYDIYMVHVYEGEPGAGDYYGVNMTATVASKDMWKGKGWNQHGGVYVRWCGAYCKSFFVESHLLSKADHTNWKDALPNISFTAGGYPSPATTNGETEYVESNTFSLSSSLTVGGSKTNSTDSQGNPSSSTKKELKLNVSASWEWGSEKKRTIKDVSIANASHGNSAAWQLTFNNLPEFDWDEDKGFKIGENEAARNTQTLPTQWLWYDKTGKDNEDREPYMICTHFTMKHALQSFISTKADLQEEERGVTNLTKVGWLITEDYVDPKYMIKLPKMVNATVGKLTIKNNMANNMTISNIKVLTSDGTEVSEYLNSVANGEELDLGYYNTTKEYTVTFKARTTNGVTTNYKYSLNPTIKLSHKQTTPLLAASDFKKQ